MRKKSLLFLGIAVLAIIVAISAVIFVNGNSDGKRLSEQLELGQKYLSELEYEQAVVAFTEALSIDPKNGEAYMGLADAYMGLGDLEAVRKVLEEGYEATGDERLRVRLEELAEEAGRNGSEQEAGADDGTEAPENQNEIPPIQFPFTLTEIKIMGYDLFDYHYDEVAAAIRATFPSTIIPSWQEDPEAAWYIEGNYGWEEYIQRTESYDYEVTFHEEHYLEYIVRTNPDFDAICSLRYDENLHGVDGIGVELYSYLTAPEEFSLVKEGMMVDIPFMPGISEEELMEIMQINEIRETAILSEEDEFYTEYTFLDSSLGKGYYIENRFSDDGVTYNLEFYLEEGGIFRLSAEINDTGQVYNISVAYDPEEVYFVVPEQ